MSKLTPPALQNLKRREDFYRQHPELQESKYELDRIKSIRESKMVKRVKRAKYSKSLNDTDAIEAAVDGAEFYRKLKEKDSLDKSKNKKEGIFKRILKIFNRGK